jgi:hypothetical protein
LWKWLYYQKQSTCSMQSLSKLQVHSSQRQKKNQYWSSYGNKGFQIAKAILSKKFNARDITIPISNYITEL